MREGREDLARIRTEEVIQNDNLIIALEILVLHCERLQVRANILDHVVAQKNARKQADQKRTTQSTGNVKSASGTKQPAEGGGFSFWSLFGWKSPSATPPPTNANGSEASTPAATTDASSQNLEPTQPVSSTPSSPAPVAPEREEREVCVEPELDRAAAAIFYSYVHIPRDIPGLNDLRLKLIHRWGQDFARKAEEADPSIVEISRDLVERLRLENPSETLVEGYLMEIARSHKIPWQGETWSEEEEEEKEEGEPSQVAAQPASTEKSGVQDQSSKGTVSDADELAKRFAALNKR